MSIYEKLAIVQQKLKSPKTEYSKFGKYYYRTAEGIMEAVKPLLEENRTLLTLSDDIVMIGDRIYVKSTAELVDLETPEGVCVRISAFAREDAERPKYSESQLTGAASSYARKYALSGLFLLTDEKDADAMADAPDPADDSDEELNKADPDPEPRERRRRKRKEKDPMQEEFMNIPEDVDEEEGMPFGNKVKEDTYFYITSEDNYVLKHAGDEEPIGGKKISKEEYEEGVNRIAKRTAEEAPKRTRRRRKERE